MKKVFYLLLVMFMALASYAHDLEVKNADGVTIYYNYINDNTEFAVTYRGNYSYEYMYEYEGKVVIPEEMTHMNRTCKVTCIEKEAFCSCYKLTSVTIPSSVKTIEYLIFPS